MVSLCEQCGAVLPPSARRSRRFCSNRCRVAASRAEVPVAVPTEGPVTAAVTAALAEVSFGAADGARAALALALSRLVDGGSVPAAAQLRGVLDDLDMADDFEHLEFLEAVRTPGQLGTRPKRSTNGAADA